MELTVHGFLFMPDTNPPYHWPGKIATIKLIRALHTAPSAQVCPLLDAKYAAENPQAALEYFERNNSLAGCFDDGNCLLIIKQEFKITTTGVKLEDLLLGAVMSNNNNMMALVAKAIRKYGADYVVC